MTINERLRALGINTGFIDSDFHAVLDRYEAALAVLRRLEWSKPPGVDDQPYTVRCPECNAAAYQSQVSDAVKGSHARDCALAAALAP
jgi:hypothetical protein